MDVEKELRLYKTSNEFAEDCLSFKSECVIKGEALPDDLTIEEAVIAEKQKELEAKKECSEKGHSFLEGDEELIDGRLWACCSRCGVWLEKKGEYGK